MALTKKDLAEIQIMIDATLDARAITKETLNAEVVPENDFARWEKEGFKTKVGLLAPENFKLNGKEHFTWDEAMALEFPDGWRLPTIGEWAMICEEFAKNDEGYLTGDALSKALDLPFAGGIWDGDEYASDQGSNGCYWSSTAYSSASAYYLYYNSGSVYPAYYSGKLSGFAVRLIKGDN